MAPKRKNKQDGVLVDFSKSTVASLKNECQSRSLPVDGRKVDLVKRLTDYESTNAAAPSTKVKKEEEDFSKLTLPKLKAECKARNLPTDGKKADLLKRLIDNTNGTTSTITAIKQEDEQAPPVTMKDKLKAMAEKEKRNKQFTARKVDSYCSLVNAEVVVDYDCMLNQTNVGNNNNKFYVIQLLHTASNNCYYVWNRWGRVGESGANALKGAFNDLETAEKEFCKKFKDKTKNDWMSREDFQPKPGKYTLIEMDAAGEDANEVEEKLAKLDAIDGTVSKKVTRACRLDKSTQALIKLIFDNNMFKEALAKLDIDVKKMPLGKISKIQIAKGFEVLEEIEGILKAGSSRTNLTHLTSQFFTVIPHNFGRQRPPLIDDPEVLQKKMDMLAVLGDIEIAQALQKTDVKTEETEVDHPLDVNYSLLNCGLTYVDPKSQTYNMINTYVEKTKSTYAEKTKLKLLDVWEVDRNNEEERFSEHKDIAHRKLLWHGTNVAVVVAILKSGLRIMPHSGGRVGRGIYFASENAKSAAYVGTSGDGTGIMFLNEVVLGKQHVITRDDSSLMQPPSGCDSVLAKGIQEPDPKYDTTIKFGEHDVIVPQGKPIKTDTQQSSFHQSEYLVYKESQNRIRYMLKIKFR